MRLCGLWCGRGWKWNAHHTALIMYDYVWRGVCSPVVILPLHCSCLCHVDLATFGAWHLEKTNDSQWKDFEFLGVPASIRLVVYVVHVAPPPRSLSRDPVSLHSNLSNGKKRFQYLEMHRGCKPNHTTIITTTTSSCSPFPSVKLLLKKRSPPSLCSDGHVLITRRDSRSFIQT